jgi:hypothetical protein
VPAPPLSHARRRRCLGIRCHRLPMRAIALSTPIPLLVRRRRCKATTDPWVPLLLMPLLPPTRKGTGGDGKDV